MKILVTGGAGFIGSAVIRHIINNTNDSVINVDKLTYAGNLENLKEVDTSDRYEFEMVDICNRKDIDRVFCTYQPDVIMHLAAESHVDRSIDGPAEFVTTNVVGTYAMLEAARTYWSDLPDEAKQHFRFVHISTDEVFGSLGAEGHFSETTPYDPSSPYSASKAGSDHLARAWQRTYGLPVVVSNCSNNYGPRQFPEKLIPLMVLNALEGKALPVYGTGTNVRDWLHVEDHARALKMMAEHGVPGEVYCVGGGSERTNLQIVHEVCRILDARRPENAPHADLIEFVTDRPGHDFRYAIDASKIDTKLGWTPRQDFEAGLEETIDWYLTHEAWWRPLRDKHYSGERLGVKA